MLYLLRDISTSVYALKMLRPSQMSPLHHRLLYCLQDRIISLLQVMHTAKYIEVEPSYKNCHIDIYFKTKTAIAHEAKYRTKCHIFPSIIQSYATVPVALTNASKPQLR